MMNRLVGTRFENAFLSRPETRKEPTMQTNPLAANRSVMQTTNPTIVSRKQAAGTRPESIAPRSRGADTVILSRAALAQTRPPNAQNAQAAASAKSAPVGPPISANPVTPEAPQGTPRTFGQSTLELVREHFGARKEDENYNFEADADGNGVIDFKDMTYVLANWGQTRT
jgi:hypothetical protein